MIINKYAPYQPRNAAVLKHGRPRTSDTAIIIWASRFSYVVLHKSLRRGSPRGVLVPVFPSKIAQCSQCFPHVFLICSPFNKFAYHLSPPLIPFRKKKNNKTKENKTEKKRKKTPKAKIWKKRIDCMWRSICVTRHLKLLSKIHNPSESDEH